MEEHRHGHVPSLPGHRGRRRALNCCAACAASAGVRARARRPRAAWAWVAMLAGVAALVPLAAQSGDPGQPGTAHAAVAVSQASAAAQVEGAGSTEAAPVLLRAVAKAAAEEAEGTPEVHWRDSTALGTPNGGSLVNGVQLPARGAGFYTYNPATQTPPGGDDRRWGTDRLVREVLDLGEWWARTYPNQPRIGVGDLSRPNGGHFPGPGVGHASHQNGLDVDFRLPRRDGVEGQANEHNYDRELTQAIVDRLLARGASLILIGDDLDITGPPGVVMPWPAHNDHLHVRFPNPG